MSLYKRQNLLRNHSDICALFEKLERRRSRITVYFGGRNNSFTTYLVDHDSQALIFHNPCDIEVTRKIVDADSMLFNSICSGVPVNFVATGMKEVIFDGKSAFSIPLPHSIHWMQRREFSRIRTPVVQAAVCEIKFRNGETSRNALWDISHGGLGMMSDHDEQQFMQGAELEDCNIILPDQQSIRATLRICSRAKIPLDDGISATRYGCEFLGMAESEKHKLQHFIGNA